MASKALPLAFGAVVLAGLGIALAQGSAGASSPAGSGQPRVQRTSTTGDPPKDVLDQIVAAVKSRDPAKMRKTADDLDAKGYPIQADDLRKAADIAAFLNSTGLSMPSASPAPTDPSVQGDVPQHGPARPKAWSPAPGLIGEMEPEIDVNRGRLIAQRLVREMEKPRGEEDRDVVRAFQVANGLKASGNYTPATAMALAVKFGLVPPAPYWPKNGRVKARKNYVGLLRQLAERDPQRAEEWQLAAEEIGT